LINDDDYDESMIIYTNSFSMLPGVEIHASNSGDSTAGTSPDDDDDVDNDDGVDDDVDDIDDDEDTSPDDDDDEDEDSMAAVIGFFLDGRSLEIVNREK
jgi:hypothetical protein